MCQILCATVLDVIFMLSSITKLVGFMQFEVQPGNTTLPLNQMSNATFYCTCDACILSLLWSLENEGRYFITDDGNDRGILAERGIIYSSTDTSAVISIPDTMENNNTLIRCAAFHSGSNEYSDPPVELIIIGPPLPPDPVLLISRSSQIDIQWEISYSHPRYPIVSFYIQIVNMSSGEMLEWVGLQPNRTSYVYTFEDDVQYCQILTVNITAVSAVGPSVPGSVSIGFPIAPNPFEININVVVTFLGNGTPMADITFEAPVICDYQMADYTLKIEDITDPRLNLEPIMSTYTGGNRYVMEVITSGLTIDHNYMLFVCVVENLIKIEASKSIYFTTSDSFQPGPNATDMSSDNLHQLGIYVGVPVAVLSFLLMVVIVIIAIFMFSIVRKEKKWRDASQRPTRLSVDGTEITNEQNVAAYEQEHTYETVSDYTIEVTHPHPQHNYSPCNRSNIDTSRYLHAEKHQYEEVLSRYEKTPHFDVNQLLETDSDGLEQRMNSPNTCSHDPLVDNKEQYDKICQYEGISRYEKVSHCDVNQVGMYTLEAASENKNGHEQRINNPNTCFHDPGPLKVDNPGHYNRICRYESISHYEKAPHCDPSLISSSQKIMGDEQWPPP